MAGGTRVQGLDAPAGGVVADPLRECRAVFTIDVHPARTLSVQEAVRDELNSKLMRCVPPLPLRAKPQAPQAAQRGAVNASRDDACRTRARSYDEQLGGVMLAYWQDRVVGTTVRRPRSRAAGCTAAAAATTDCGALRPRQAQMLDIIPYVCVTVNAHVLLFKPRVGTNMGARPVPRLMCCKPSALCACPFARTGARRRLPRALHAVHRSCKRRAALACAAALCAAADVTAAARRCAVGRVNLVGADHVGLLVCNAFNVSISRENIRKDLRFVETVRLRRPPQRWRAGSPPASRQAFGGDDRARLESTRDRAHVISSGMDVLFTVKGCARPRLRRSSVAERSRRFAAARMQDSEELLSLSGALLEEGTGSLAYLQQHAAGAPAAAADGEAGAGDDEEERRRRKRERRAARAAAAAEAAAPVEPAAAEPQEAPRAEAGGSRKRKKGEDAAPAEIPAEAEEEPEPEKARKHKKKHKTDRHRDDAANGDQQ